MCEKHGLLWRSLLRKGVSSHGSEGSMDVKDVKPVTTAEVPVTQRMREKTQTKEEKPGFESDVTVDIRSRNNAVAEMVSSLNRLIGTTNVVSRASDDLNSYVRGLQGLVEQAEGGLPASRISLLEQEANQLVEAIVQTVGVKTADGMKPLSGDQIEVQLEQQLGRSLQIILPDLSGDALGLGRIKLSTSDFILNTRAMVRRSEERLRELSDAVGEAQNKVKGYADEVDIALQNAEASASAVRDVEYALRSAGNTGAQIGSNQAEALGSIGTLDPAVVGILNAD